MESSMSYACLKRQDNKSKFEAIHMNQVDEFLWSLRIGGVIVKKRIMHD